MPSLAEIRRTGGASAVRAAIETALAVYGNATAAAEALGTRPGALRRAAQRVGATWPELPPGPTPGNARMAKAAADPAKKKPAKKV